jgi:hypothetical protein
MYLDMFYYVDIFISNLTKTTNLPHFKKKLVVYRPLGLPDQAFPAAALSWG